VPRAVDVREQQHARAGVASDLGERTDERADLPAIVLVRVVRVGCIVDHDERRIGGRIANLVHRRGRLEHGAPGNDELVRECRCIGRGSVEDDETARDGERVELVGVADRAQAPADKLAGIFQRDEHRAPLRARE
jgi:hypothetical protein